MRIKQDVLPDRYTFLWFTATKTGIFHLTCAEFCGTDHSGMSGQLIILEPQDYARWTAAQPQGDDLAHRGEALFRSLGCSGCHAAGASVHAPDLHGLYGRPVHLGDGRIVIADEAYLREFDPAAEQGHRRRLLADHAELHRTWRAKATSWSSWPI